MTTIRASAPGKLFLLGEYAVLEGAPAMLTAVDRRVTVQITTSDRWRVTAVGLPGGQRGERYLGPDGELPATLGAHNG